MRWIMERQEADGSWGGIQPPWIYSIIALHTLGLPLDHPVMAQGDRRASTTRSPSTSTAASACASRPACRRSGTPASRRSPWPTRAPAGDDPALRSACDWMLSKEVTRIGDWRFVPRPRPRGRVVVRVRERVVPRHRRHRRGAHRAAPRRPPAVAPGDPPRRRLAARHAERRRRLGRVRRRQRPADHDPAAAVRLRRGHRPAHRGRHGPRRRGAGRVRRAAQPPGGARAASPTCGAPSAPTARGGAAGASTTSTAPAPPCRRWRRRARTCAARRARRAVAFLAEHQNADGGWGEDIASYADPAWIGRGESTRLPDRLGAAGAPRRRPGPPRRGRGPGVPGAHPEPRRVVGRGAFTGTGLPLDFMIRYHLYRQVFPVSALGRMLG